MFYFNILPVSGAKNVTFTLTIILTVFCLTDINAQGTSIRDRVSVVLSSVADNNLKNNDFYIVAQAHNNMANTFIEKDLLFALDKNFGVHYDILEYGESAAFLINQYLSTGNDSLLHFINQDAPFSFIKAVRYYNDTTVRLRKITFYGLDFESRHHGAITQKALEIIFSKSRIPVKRPLYTLIQKIITCSPTKIGENLDKLKSYVNNNKQECRDMLGEYFIPVLLMANAKYSFSHRRSQWMFNNFKLLYNELIKKEKDPKFLASFGYGHTNPKEKSTFAMKLLKRNDSPVKNHVSILGTQYFNCYFFNGYKILLLKSTGTLSHLLPESEIENLNKSTNNKSETLYFINKRQLSRFRDRYTSYLSGVFIVKNFGYSKYYTWE